MCLCVGGGGWWCWMMAGGGLNVEAGDVRCRRTEEAECL